MNRLPEMKNPCVSRETQNRMDLYAALLRKWQAKINLVSPESLADLYIRHFQDSLQLLPYLSEGLRVVDLGSGAGFPGLVLAMARPDLEVHLVESDAKKCEFLKAVSRETQTPVVIHNNRIETTPPFFVNTITARALAGLDKLLAYSMPFIKENQNLDLILLKGESWADEVAAARQTYSFDLQDFPSVTHPKARVLVLTRIHPTA